MGAGNTRLRSFDPEKFEPVTYFLDLSVEPEEGEERDYFLEELNFEDLLESLSSELELTNLYNENEYHSGLCAAFRQDGILLLEGELTYIITETGAEYHHLPIAVIPNFKWEDLRDDIKYQEGDKRDWYDTRGLDFDERLDKLADKEYHKKLKEFSKESNKILTTLHGWYDKGMSQRNGAWMSIPLVQVGEDHFKLAS
jgi:hypothetical protein